MRRLGVIVMLVAIFVATLPPRAWAHNAQVTALINLGVPHPGQASAITIELLDVLGGNIPDARVRVLFETSSERVINASTLVEQGTIYQGNVTVPAPGAAIFRLEVTLPDGVYAVQFPVQIRTNTEVLPGAVFELYHADAGAPASPGSQPQPPRPQPAPSTPTAQAPAKTPQPTTPPQSAPTPTPTAPQQQTTAPTGTPPVAVSQAQPATVQPAQTAPTAPQPTPTTSAPGPSGDQPAAAVAPAAPADTSPAPAVESRYARFPWVIVAAALMLLISGSTFPRKGRQ